jgi:stage III sporulation protein AA
MGPRWIAVDEITAQEDCQALLNAGWSGVSLLATAHAEDLSDLFDRPVYRPIVNSKLFDTVLILNEDKSWIAERMR